MTHRSVADEIVEEEHVVMVMSVGLGAKLLDFGGKQTVVVELHPNWLEELEIHRYVLVKPQNLTQLTSLSFLDI